MFQGLTCGGHGIFAQHACVSPLPLAAVGHERAIYFPRPLRTQGIWHPIFDVLPNGIYSASVNLQLWPATTWLISGKFSLDVSYRSIRHVCKFKERYHPPRPPHPTLAIWQVANEKTIWTFVWQKVHKTLTKCMFWKFDDFFYRKFAMNIWASSGPWREHGKCTKYCK